MIQSFSINIDAIKNSGLGDNSGARTNWMRFSPGRTKIRILPPWSSAGQIAKTVCTHSIEYHSENVNKWRFTCPVHSHTAESCPICDHLNMLKSQGLPVDAFTKMGKEYWANALVVEDPNYDGAQRGYAPGTHVLICLPKTVLNYIYESLMNPLIGNVTDLETGVDFEVMKSGQGLNTRYTTKTLGRRDIREEVKDMELYDLDALFNSAGSEEMMTELKMYLTQEVSATNQARTAMGMAPQPSASIPYVPPMATATVPTAGNATANPFPRPAVQPVQSVPQSNPTIPNTTANPFNNGAQQPVAQAADMVRPADCPGKYAPDTVTCLICANAGKCMSM